ncbi:MAG TPA: ABC transporter ATP-binding protein [Brevefilum sp.]|nr:ABC transporter ATP-binding protein [Brevefilum sp.]HOR19665.1 ABC transporter ATP-binding protein [Brevefilum sp.]HPL70077.1 ABC transporter ATP-binding protein [Brevefilum sp.]
MRRRNWRSYINAAEEKPHLSWKQIRRVLQYGKPYTWRMIASLISILATTGVALLSPLILRYLIDNAIPNKDLQRLFMAAIGLLLLPIISGLFQVITRRLVSQIGEGVIYDLRVSLYKHLQHMSLRFFTHTQLGELISRLNNDVIGAQTAISRTLVTLLTSFIEVVTTLVVMLMLEWRLTLLGIIIIPLFIITARRLGRVFRNIARQQMEMNARMNANMNETLNIGGALLVKLFGQREAEIERFSNRAYEVKTLGIKRATMAIVFTVIVHLLTAVGSALVYGVGGYLVILEMFTLGTIVAFGDYLSRLYNSFQGFINAPVEFATSMVSFERVFEVIDLPIDIEERPDAIPLEDPQGRLEFDRVNFKYFDSNHGLLKDVDRPYSVEQVGGILSDQALQPSDSSLPGTSQAREMALKDITFVANSGDLVALVGPSGAGKTTLTYLIPRLYDPNEGAIRLDGHDLRDLRLDDLADSIGMVTQETYLFHDTIRANLLYANPDASSEDLVNAAQAANIHHFIMDLPEGYNTVVGERGYRLSGGEKQRLALARVLLKDPRIMILDEATSHLDSESEALIQEALERMYANRTSIVIAHRLSTILSADLILVMDKGEVIERGTHQDLLALGGLYAQLYETQFKQ